MSLLLSGDLRLAKTYVGTDDPDAAAYIAAVETADGQALETATKVAIHSFVKGAKADGFWPAIKASCILAGARTLNGALVPLVGTAPTNLGLSSYNRKTGLAGDYTANNYLDTNRNARLDGTTNRHFSAYATQVAPLNQFQALIEAGIFGVGHNGVSLRNTGTWFATINENVTTVIDATNKNPGFLGAQRSSSTFSQFRFPGGLVNSYVQSATPIDRNYFILTRVNATLNTPHRVAFYSIGESLDLALLDARVTDLINAFAAAIP